MLHIKIIHDNIGEDDWKAGKECLDKFTKAIQTPYSWTNRIDTGRPHDVLVVMLDTLKWEATINKLPSDMMHTLEYAIRDNIPIFIIYKLRRFIRGCNLYPATINEGMISALPRDSWDNSLENMFLVKYSSKRTHHYNDDELIDIQDNTIAGGILAKHSKGIYEREMIQDNTILLLMK